MEIRATYRLQFHAGFTFADAEAQLDYFAALGISHLYASPIATAQPGSTHGYDGVDPTTVNPELGGEPGLRRLVAGLRERRMGLVIDIVPNHLGVAGSANRWWQDVLEHGRDSIYAGTFDIDWDEPILLPILGTPLDRAIAEGALTFAEDPEGGIALMAYGAYRLPIRPQDRPGLADRPAPGSSAENILIGDVLARQHYRLAWWRAANDSLNWRRFFTVTELAGLRIEDRAVFDRVHALPLRLYREGLVDGLRVDHVDGLTDPGAYCLLLRAELDAAHAARPAPLRAPPPYLLVEKILAGDEALAADWGVDGTTGYDFMDHVSALQHDPRGEGPLAAHWARISGRSPRFADEELDARRDMLGWEFEGQLARTVTAFLALARKAPGRDHLTPGMVRRAVVALLLAFPVYRTYGTGDAAPPSDAAIRTLARDRAAPLAGPGELPTIDMILEWLAGEGPGPLELRRDAVRRFQQLSAPIAAKAVEDTAFYRYGRLLSRNDVGFDVERFSLAADAFHARMADRAQAWPRAMLTTATHDHKRGEDVRARLAVLSEIGAEWIAMSGQWLERVGPKAEGLDRGDVYQILQMLFGAWPLDGLASDTDGQFADRICGWLEKALREAKLRSSWAAPDAEYEDRAKALVVHLLDPAQSPPFIAGMDRFVARVAPAAIANGLAQVFLRCTAPGVPDLYQGAECADLSLVDPDNRRPVDYAARRAALSRNEAVSYNERKQRLIACILNARRHLPDLWSRGDYRPVGITGARAGHVLAFTRSHGETTLLAAVLVACADPLIAARRAQPPSQWWHDTRLDLPGLGPGHDVLASCGLNRAPTAAASLFADGPVHLSIHGPGADRLMRTQD